MTIPVYDEMIVRRRLMTHCQMLGGVAAFSRAHGFHEIYVNEALRGQSVLSVKLLRVLGYERVTRYVEAYVPLPQTQAVGDR